MDLLHAVGRHKDVFDLAIKALGMLGTIAGGLWIAWKYFADRRQERLKTELDLKREAYLDFFSAIPLQLAALGKFARDRDPIVLRPKHTEPCIGFICWPGTTPWSA